MEMVPDAATFPPIMSEATERIEFTGAWGLRLVGRLHRAPGRPLAHALFAHCFTCGKDLRAAVRLSNALARHGISTFRFDFTGLGESEGDFGHTDFSSNVQDLVAAADMMRARLEAPALLVGHSLGGAAVLAAAPEVPEARAVAVLGAPYDPAHVRTLIEGGEEGRDAAGRLLVRIAERVFPLDPRFLDDLEQQRAHGSLAQLGKALLVMHAPGDAVVSVDEGHRIFDAAAHPKSFVSLDGAGHLLGRKRDADYAGQVLASWAGRYLGEEAAEERETERGVVEVEGSTQGYAQRIHAGPHELTGDEPLSVPGGTDTGPTPYELLLAALGTCTSMTLRMYADRKGWPLEGVHVRLEHDRIHAEDCAHCESTDGRIDRIRRVIAIDGDLDGEQRARLMEIADRCPVHRTLTSETIIETRVSGEGDRT
jgi:uncharacterized OsmC-like protein/alpha-beta hydrolase superfamily lysophospholipase